MAIQDVALFHRLRIFQAELFGRDIRSRRGIEAREQHSSIPVANISSQAALVM